MSVSFAMAEFEHLSMTIEDLSGHLSYSLTSQSQLESKILTLEHGYQQLITVIEGKTRLTSELRSQNSLLNEENSQLKSQLSSLTSHLQSAQDEIKSLTEKIDFLTAETTAYQQTAPSPPTKHAETIKEKLRKAELTIETLKQEKIKLKTQGWERMTAIRTNVALKQQVELLKKELESGKTEANKAKKALLGVVTAVILKYKKKYTKLWVFNGLKSGENDQKSQSDLIFSLKSKIDDLRTRHRNLFSQSLSLFPCSDSISIDLHHCGIPAEWIDWLFTRLNTVENVVSLDLSGNRVGDMVVGHVLRLKRLRKVNVGYTGLSGVGTRGLMEGLKGLDVESVNIGGNEVNVRDLTEFVRDTQGLKELGIAEIGVQLPSDVKILGETISESGLKALDVSGNPMSGTQLQSFLGYIGTMKWQKLSLARTSLSDVHSDLLYRLINASPDLQELSIAYTHFSSSTLSLLCHSLHSCLHLHKLDASGTVIPVPSLCTLLTHCPSLFELHLKDISFTEDELTRLGQTVSTAVNLQVCLIDQPREVALSLV